MFIDEPPRAKKVWTSLSEEEEEDNADTDADDGDDGNDEDEATNFRSWVEFNSSMTS